MGSKSTAFGGCIPILILTSLLLLPASAFAFKQLGISANSYVTNVTATYTILYDTYIQNNFLTTAWNTTTYTSSSTVTLSFPVQYTLPATIGCSYSINNTGTFTTNPCTVSGNVITLTNVFNNVVARTFSLMVTGVLNPYPAGTTSNFTGSIGGNTATPNGVLSLVTIIPATSQCSFTFSPNYVYLSPANMIITLTITNQFPLNGLIAVKFPSTRIWSQDLNTSRTIPIVSSMVCNNVSANVNSGVQCTGSVATAIVSLSNVVSTTQNPSTVLSFTINTLNSPPTNQAVDAITVTTYTSGGAAIDSCNAYVTGLLPQVIPSSQFLVGQTNDIPMVVNQQYTLKFDITTILAISLSDTVVITFPTGTGINSFATASMGGTIGINQAASTYLNQQLTIYFSGSGTLNPQQIYLYISNFIAPPSTATSAPFTINFMSNGFPRMTATQTITAVTNTLSGLAAMTTTTVNLPSTYTFSLTTNDPITSAGQIKVIFPTVLSITITSTCAALTGTLLNVSPTCTYNSIDNSITFTALNSSSSNIPAQTLTLTVTGITNPPSTQTTPTFTVTTFYNSNSDAKVNAGALTGVTANKATIDYTKVVIGSSSLKNSDTSVSYYVSFVINNRIASGGFIVIYFPSQVSFTLSAVPSQCQISFNASSASSTTCTAALATNYYVFNFSSPFSSISGQVGTNVTLGIVGSATNPSSTTPFGPFSIFTYYNDATLVATLQNALSSSTSVPSVFSYNQFSKVSSTNSELTTYTITLIQIAALEAGAKILVTFPAATLPQNSSVCSLGYGSTAPIGCSLSGRIFTITTGSTVINAGDTFTLQFTNIRNPLSFTSLSGISTTTKTSNGLYLYSSGSTTNSLQNTVPSSFKNISYLYSPRQLNQSIVLKVNFQLSQYNLMPSYILLSIDTYFTVSTLSCTSFINFVGSCSSVSSNTVKVTGSFNNSVMGLTISGFNSQTITPATSTFTTLSSFESSDGKMDQSLTDISFSLVCTLPCMTCSATNSSQCLSCYNSTTITPSIYFYSTNSQCYTLCPDTTYNNATTLSCQICDSNCFTCLNKPNNCTKCVSSSTYPYLNITATSQVCVASCVAGMYPQNATNPVTCTACKSPCDTCLNSTRCLTCLSGFFYVGNNTCDTSCPVGTTVANISTKNCDPCASICLKCAGTVSTCTACNTPYVFFNGSCQTSCPSDGTLAPYQGVCTACNSTCLLCSGTITNCTSCNLNSSFPFFVNNSCLSSCPQRFYNVTVTGQCLSCASANINCVNCSSASTCLSCDLSFVYFATNKSCLSAVPSGYVNISGVAVICAGDCKTCSNTTSNCTSCKTNNLQNNQCLGNCLAGFIAVSQVCLACTSPCATCSVIQANCTSCLSPLSPQLYLSNFICQQTCPPSTYPNASNFECSACVSPCSLCTTLLACTSCVAGRFLYNSSCINPCPGGYVGISGICQACTQNCKTCSGAINSCLTCVNGTYFLSSSNSCVTSCNPSLFIDYANQMCVGCTAPCDTCVNSSTNCLSCKAGYLFYKNQCLTSCPSGMFVQANTTCVACSNNCAVCTSLTACSECSGSTYLYNNACVNNCPGAFAVIVNGSCTACSTQACATCNGADVCLTCKSGFLFFNAVCLTNCTEGYYSNGTHCLSKVTVTAQITAPTTFPVPFSIAGAVFIIACLMSRLQFSQTYLSGAVYSFIGILQVLALIYFLYLYLIGYYSTQPIPLFIGLGALGFLYILNIIASLAQSIFLCYQKQFQTWRSQSGFHKCFYGLISILSLVINHKIRNILFCKLFTFKIFSAKLDRVDHFRIFNIFSLLSIVHSGGAIFAAAVAFKYIDKTEQVFYQCIDVIVLSALNAVLAFFNAHKDKDFFEEVTPEGFSLHKKNHIDQDHLPGKIQAQGHDGEIEEGFLNDYNHALVSKAALKFDEGSLNEIYSESSMANIKYSDKSSEKQYEEISVQALDLIDQKANVTAKTNIVKSNYRPVFQEISIQVQEIIKQEKKDMGIDLSQLPPQGFENDSSNFTAYNYFKKVDRSAQSHLNRPVNHSAQVEFKQMDQSIQKYQTLELNDFSVQKDANISKVDFSIQKDRSRAKVDHSIQGSLGQHDVSIQPSFANHDVSISMSRREMSMGIQQKADFSEKNISAIASMRNQSNQLSVISQQDEEIQMGADMNDYGIQPNIQYNQIAVQPSLEVENQVIHPEFNEMAIQYEPGDDVAFNQFQEELDHTNTNSNLLYDLEEQAAPGEQQMNLQEERAEHLELQVDQIKSYQEELEERIRQREKELNEVKRKIMVKERINEKKRHDIQNPAREEPIRLEAIKIMETTPRERSNRSGISEKPIQTILPRIDNKPSIVPKPSVAAKNEPNIDISLDIYSKEMSKQMSKEMPKNGQNKSQRREESVSEDQGLVHDTIQQIKVQKKNETDKESFRQSQLQKTIELIKKDEMPKEDHKNKKQNQPKKNNKDYDHIQYKQYQNELESHEDSEQHKNEQNKRMLDFAFEPRPEKQTEAQKQKKKQQEAAYYDRKHHQNERNQNHHQQRKQFKPEAIQNIQNEVLSNKQQSQLTQKNFITSNKKSVVVDVVQIDRDLSGQEDLQLQQQVNESEPEPTGIQQFKQKQRERSQNSSLQGTIEEIPKHYTKIDNDKTVGNNSFVQAQAKKYAITSRIGKDDVINYFNNNMQNAGQAKNKGREIPKEADLGQKYHINKLYSREDLAHRPNVAQSRPKNGQAEQPNTLAMAGRAQFAQDIVKRKQREIKNPLHTQKNWQAQNEDKYISDEDNHIAHEANRKNLVRNNNKNLQNFASHLVLPQQSDKQQTTFQKAARKVEKQEKPVSEKRKNERRTRQEPQQIQVNFQGDKLSQDLSIGGNLVPQIPRTNVRKSTSNATSSLYGDAYNEGEEVDYRGMMLLGQMQQRPNNDDLDQYYKRKRDSKEKRKPSNSRLDKSTEKIYMQRLDRKK